MANLVPLHLDKETGQIVARGGPFGQGGPGSNANGFLYEQVLPSASWPVPHNELTDQVLVQVYDDVGEFTIPDKIEIVDINNIEITFGAPMAGTAHILFFNTT